MKKIFAMLIAMMMVLSMGVTAFASPDDELVHAGALPATSTQDVRITISALTDGSGSDPDHRLPSEYHVGLLWEVQDGIYDATASDSSEAGGFKNFVWDCEKLDFNVNEVADGENDVRVANWAQMPMVRFEVTNASTPDLPITATPSLNSDDTWAPYLKAESISAQNIAVGTQTIAPVLRENLGSGVDSYEEGVAPWGGAHNTYSYEYELNWDYNALNQKALDSYKAGTGTLEFVNTFVVTINKAA